MSLRGPPSRKIDDKLQDSDIKKRGNLNSSLIPLVRLSHCHLPRISNAEAHAVCISKNGLFGKTVCRDVS